MSDNIGRNLGNILGNAARNEIKRNPRVNIPAPPVLNPVAQAAASVASSAGQAAGSIVRNAIPDPPRLTFFQSLGNDVAQRAATIMPNVNATASTVPMTKPNWRVMAEDAVRTAYAAKEQSWGIYQVNEQPIAMPEYIGEKNQFPLLSNGTTSDPETVAGMRDHRQSYLNQSPEIQALIKTPSGDGIGRQVASAVEQVKPSVADLPPAEKADALAEFATGALTGGMKHGADNFTAQQTAYTLVKSKDGSDQVILTRDEWANADESWKSGYNVVTDKISEREFQSIQASGVADQYGEFRTQPPVVDSTIATAALDQATAVTATTGILTERVVDSRNKALRDKARGQDVVVIDGRAYPAGTTEPWNLLTHSDQDRIGLEILPAAPDGWVWVSNGGASAWLVIEQRDASGDLILSDGSYEVEAYDTTPVYGLTDPIADKALWLFEDVAADAITWIMESDSVPEIAKRGLAGFFEVVGMPQQQNIDNITKVVLYPDDVSNTREVLSLPTRIFPPVARYETWITDNPEAAKAAYENGYDTDNDGTNDVFGADAVTYLWRDEDLSGPGGSTTWFLFQIATDPLTYAAGAGVVGKVVGRAGSKWALSANPLVQTAGRVALPVGRGIEIGARVVEGAADLGLPFVLDGGAWLFRKAGVTKVTASALYKNEIDDVTTVHQEAVSDKVAPLNTTARGVRIASEDGTGWIYEPAPGDEATTGPAARKKRDADNPIVEEAKDADEAIPEGYEETTRAGVATKTKDGWDVATDDGIKKADSSAEVDAIVNSLEGSADNPVPPRYRRKPIEEGQPVHYIDPLPQEVYDILIENRLPEMVESVEWMKSLNVDDAGITTTPRHLKESNRMARVIMDLTEEVHPGYYQPWHRNGGTSPAYVLAESFQRSDWPSASRWWGYMTGNGGVVDLPGGRYRASVATVDLTIPSRKSKTAVSRANDTVDIVMDRLHWHPNDINIPEFAAVVQQAAELDYWLRTNNLRYSDPIHDLPPIVSLIPDGITISLRPEVRALSPYEGSTARVAASDGPGEYIGSIRVTEDGAVTLDIYELPFDQVPDEWAAMFPDDTEGTWARAYAHIAGDEGFNVYAPDAGWASRMAEETLAARGIPGTGEVIPADHVAQAEGTQEAVGSPESAASPDPVSVLDSDGVTVPEPTTATVSTLPASQAEQIAEIRRMLDNLEGIEPAGSVVVEEVSSSPTRAEMDAEATANTEAKQGSINKAATGTDAPSPGRMVSKTAEVQLDPTGTLEMPVYEPTVDVEPTARMTEPAQKVIDDVFNLPEGSPKLKAIGTQVTRELATTRSQLPRSGAAVEIDGNGQFYLGRRLDAPEVEALTRHPFADGETLLDRVNRKYYEAGNKQGWRNHFDFYEDLSWTESLAEYEAHLMQKPEFTPGVLPQPVKNVIAKLPEPVQKVLAGVAWAMRRLLLGPYDALNRFYRERTLFRNDKFLHYPAVQYFGNLHLAVVGGKFREMAYMMNLRNVHRSFNTVTLRETRPSLLWGETQTPNQRLLQNLGVKQAPETSDVFRNLGAGKVDDLLIGQKWLDSKGRVGKAASKIVGSRWTKEMGAAMDYLWRDAIEYVGYKSGTALATPDFRNMVSNRLVARGMKPEEAARFWSDFIDRYPNGEFDYNAIVSHYSPLVSRGVAERMGRDWRQTLNGIRRETRGDIRKYGFAQPETRVDLVAKRAFAFHFFQSRQTWYLMRQMADHPFLINLYFTLQEELERMSEDWPPYLRGWVKMLPSFAGRQMFTNPTALLQTYTMFKESYTSWDEGEIVDGEGQEVGFWPWLLNTAVAVDEEVGLAIPISKAMNVTGMRGDIWSPDLLAINSEANIFTLGWNWLEFNGIVPGDGRVNGNINTDINNLVREKVSSIFPGSEEIVARSSAQSMDVEITNIAMDIARNDMGLDPENDGDYRIILTLLNDPESELYRESYKKWLKGETFEVGARMIVGPWRPRFRQLNSEGEDLNTNRTQRERQAANTADKRVGIFWLQNNQYYEIGTQRIQGAAGIWTDIAYGVPKSSVTVNGITYSSDEIMAMNEDQRKAIANGAMAELGLMDDINGLRDERAVFLAQPENAEFAQYQQWSQAVREYPGGPEKYWQDTAAGNPNAATYYNNFIKTAGSDAEKRRMMTGTIGMFHILGWDHSAWDKPIIGFDSPADVYDPAGVLDQPAQPKPYVENNAEYKNEVRQAPVFMAEYQNYDQQVKRIMAERGYPPGTTFNSLPSKQRTSIEDELDDQGIYEPKPSFQVQNFLEWLQVQPDGKYGTLEEAMDGYFAEDQEEYYKNLPGKTDDIVNTPAAIPGPNSQGVTAPSSSGSADDFWYTLSNILNEHDHTKYKNPLYRP